LPVSSWLHSRALALGLPRFELSVSPSARRRVFTVAGETPWSSAIFFTVCFSRSALSSSFESLKLPFGALFRSLRSPLDSSARSSFSSFSSGESGSCPKVRSCPFLCRVRPRVPLAVGFSGKSAPENALSPRNAVARRVRPSSERTPRSIRVSTAKRLSGLSTMPVNEREPRRGMPWVCYRTPAPTP
jgi:hypothetical protein